MLMHRILTAVPLAAVVVWIILYQSSDVVLYLLLFIAILAGFEWARLGGVYSVPGRLFYSLVLAAIAWILVYQPFQYTRWIVMGGALWWFVISFYLFTVKPIQKDGTLSVTKLAAGMLVVPVAVLSMYFIHSREFGAYWLLYGLALVWVADIGAYFSGKKFGKTKLAARISPGKTIEGLYGALAATFLYTLIASYFFDLHSGQTAFLLVLSVLLTLISISGDLYESLLKRERGLKDSGNILPGHGGILDRIDGVLAAMPLFLIGLNLMLYQADQP